MASSTSPTIVVIGSSVALAQGRQGWVDHLRNKLKGHASVINVSTRGWNVECVKQAFSHIVPNHNPTTVIVALSLANEGLHSLSDTQAQNVLEAFLSNLREVGRMIENIGAIPILAGMYPCGMEEMEGVPDVKQYSDYQYAIIKQACATLSQWVLSDDEPFQYMIEFLSDLDNGKGHWKRGLAVDAGHPNNLGYEVMANAINSDEILNRTRGCGKSERFGIEGGVPIKG
eukprot:m.65242 g.65242  ORF g.65242 m.65242 type:complete len:229 (+) comp23536_c0_seq1:400-1086(+)